MTYYKVRAFFRIPLIAAIFFITILAEIVMAQDPKTTPETPILPDFSDVAQYKKFGKLLETALVAEDEKIAQLRKQVAENREKAEKAATENHAREIRLSAYSNLLLLPETPVRELEKAWSAHNELLADISKEITSLQEKGEEIHQQQDQAGYQHSLNLKQMDILRNDVPDSPLTKTLIQNLNTLIRKIEDRQKYLNENQAIIEKWLADSEAIHKKFADFSDKFGQTIREKKKEALFRRETTPVHSLELARLREEILKLSHSLPTTLSGDFTLLFRQIQAKGYYVLIAFLLLFAISLWLLFRLRAYLLNLDQIHNFSERYPWRHLTLRLLCRSLVLGGVTLFLYVYAHIRTLYATAAVCRIVFYLLCAWLLSRWGLTFLKLWKERGVPLLPDPVMQRLRTLLLLIRYFTFASILTFWLLGSQSRILTWIVMGFEVTLVVWCVRFWRQVRLPEIWPDQEPVPKIFRAPLARHLSFTIALGGVFLDLAGYESLARYWYISWGINLTVLLWTALSFKLLQEWGKHLKALPPFRPDETEPGISPLLQGILLRILWLVWIECFLLAAVFAWSPDKKEVLSGYFQVLKTPISLAGLDLSLWNTGWAVMIILLTHSAIQVWRQMLSDRLLKVADMERGLKNSVTLIIAYLLWGLGILMALNTIGVNAQSITVAFGALGIGLGFGLRNIFDNFFSGLILLFERPIQVGDVIEVKGVWGEVKKVNVRSTLIQTYDNASIIIPNSDLISQQVTNWSFKDIRIRRNIVVGVAYGSEAELVRQTLLEAADNVQNALSYPRPDVVFADFGDSALTFRLRVWTDVDHGLTVETAVRFEIDRLFREKGIQIPFPQRDIHFRSGETPSFPHPAQEPDDPAPSALKKKEDI